MNRYKCPDCGGYQYTANTQAAGSPCIYCKTGNVILDNEAVPKKRLFKFVGYDSWDRPVYEGEDGALLVDTDPVLNKPMRLCTKLGNQFDGEPDTPIEFTRYKDDKVAVDRRMTWR